MATKAKPVGKEVKAVAMTPKFHQNFFTIGSDQGDDIPETKTTMRDPLNHYIEVEITESRRKKEHKPQMKESAAFESQGKVSPLPFIKVELNRNVNVDWSEVLIEANGSSDSPRRLLKTEEEEAVDPCPLPAKKAEPTQLHGLTSEGKRSGDMQHSTIHGGAISDIPTCYAVPALAAHELAVVGTFVHPYVTPGFAYRVRLNGSDGFLFDGKTLVLKSISQGYGKRLSFESQDILYNRNYFWSDSNPNEGYAFSISLPLDGCSFDVCDDKGETLGKVQVLKTEDAQIIEKKRVQKENVDIHVHIKMLCKLCLMQDCKKDGLETPLQGVAIATAANGSGACIDRIMQVEISGCGICSFEQTS